MTVVSCAIAGLSYTMALVIAVTGSQWLAWPWVPALLWATCGVIWTVLTCVSLRTP